VREELLEPSEKHTTCPRKGEASYWSVRVADRVAHDAVWRYPEPIDGCPDISRHVAIYWNAMDSWWEEDDEVFVHARDPYHRVDVLRSSRHVRVEIDGEAVAETERPLLLIETGLPPRWYIPRADVRLDLLQPTDTTKGRYRASKVLRLDARPRASTLRLKQGSASNAAAGAPRCNVSPCTYVHGLAKGDVNAKGAGEQDPQARAAHQAAVPDVPAAGVREGEPQRARIPSPFAAAEASICCSRTAAEHHETGTHAVTPGPMTAGRASGRAASTSDK
jgi:uncharacterized protein (DUF427 family)